MCAVPSDVQRQLSEALAIISQHDFPGAFLLQKGWDFDGMVICVCASVDPLNQPGPSASPNPSPSTPDHTYIITERWQTLLPDMVAKFASRDLHVINGVLRSANAILKRFRCVSRLCGFVCMKWAGLRRYARSRPTNRSMDLRPS